MALAGQKPITAFADSQFSATIFFSIAWASSNSARAGTPSFSSSNRIG
jgi:hypothetical protein